MRPGNDLTFHAQAVGPCLHARELLNQLVIVHDLEASRVLRIFPPLHIKPLSHSLIPAGIKEGSQGSARAASATPGKPPQQSGSKPRASFTHRAHQQRLPEPPPQMAPFRSSTSPSSSSSTTLTASPSSSPPPAEASSKGPTSSNRSPPSPNAKPSGAPSPTKSSKNTPPPLKKQKK